MDKDQKKQNSPLNDEFDLLLQNRKLNQQNNNNIDDFISAPTTKNVGVLDQSDDSTLGEFIAKPDAEEERGSYIATMHPELLNTLREAPKHNAPKKNGLKTALKIIVSLVLVLSIAAVAYFKLSGVDAECDKVYSEISKSVLENGQNRFSYLQELNSDTVGYLTLKDYAYPVVKPQEKDEEYYQKHLFSGAANRYGTLYTNSNVAEPGFSEIQAIYGNGTDSRMLGSIKDYQRESYAKSNPTINFDTVTDNGVWACFSAFSFKGEEPFLLDRLSFLNENLQRDYVNNFYKYSTFEYDIDATAGDKMLILIALDGETTHVAAYRLLREGETADSLTPRLKESVSVEESDSSSKDQTDSSESETASKNTESSQPSQTSSKETTSSQNTESQQESSKTTSTSSTTSKETTTKPVIKNDKRYEQTGLTKDMDKTVKVDVAPVVTMSNVVGMAKQSAVSLLKNTLGFPVEIVEKESTEKRGTVIEQSVAGGADISTDNTVTLTVSIGIPGGKTLMPDLIGLSEATVEILLDKHDLLLGKVTKTKSALETGTIISQSVDPNTEVSTNTKINIVVSDGKGELITVDMPNLKGKTKEEAQIAIKQIGLKVGKISTVTSSKPAGTVVEQEVPSGQKVAQNEAIAFSISNGSKVNNLTVKNLSSWSVTINGKTYAPGDYIKGDYMDIIPYIVEAEMGGGFGMEALKAQAVAAYCWLINAGSTQGSAPAVPLKNPTQNAIDAASAVNGRRLMYGSETAQTYYYAISAGYTANCKDVWYADIPYLRAVDSSVDKDYDGFETTVTYSASELKSRVSSTYGVDLSDVSKSKWFSIKYDENDAYARSVSIGGKKEVNGSSFRDELLDYELRSTAFKIKYNKSNDTFTFTVRGFGHGVGMSQVGANSYANKGWTYKEILAHYYPGTTLQ